MSRKYTTRFVLLCIAVYPITILYDNLQSKSHSKSIRHELTVELSALKSQLQKARRRNIRPPLSSLETVNFLLKRVNPDLNTNDVKPNVGCREEFTNSTFGRPFYEKGWIKTSKTKIKVERLVSVLLIPPLDGDCNQYITRVVEGIITTNRKVKILIGNRDNKCKDLYFGYDNVKEYHFKPEMTDGKMWNYLVGKVKTNFVLIGRNLEHWSWFSRIERQLDVFGNDENIEIVGGSTRNSTGHWKIGCYQTKMSNYDLKFTPGYYNSQNECMFCDYLTSTFITKTRFLRRLKFNDNFHSEVLFEDFFWRTKLHGKLSLICPDVMYLSTDINEQQKLRSKSMWIKFIQHYTLNSISYPPNPKLKFSCEDSNIKCSNYLVKKRHILKPPCCLESLIQTVQLIHDLSEKNNLKCEIVSGVVLGGVKLRGIIPWDIGIDVFYLENQHNQWINLSNEFISRGCNFNTSVIVHANDKPSEYFVVFTPNGDYMDLSGINNLSSKFLPEELKDVQTKVRIGDEVWINSVFNPGLYSRNLYGIEYLSNNYLTGRFYKCLKKKFHGCVNKFRFDGGLQFLIK